MATESDLGHKLAKLPMWAQDHMRRLAAERNMALSRLAELQSGEGPIAIGMNLPGERQKRFPDKDVYFDLGDSVIQCTITEKNSLLVRGNGPRWSLRVVPHCSNLIEVQLVD